MQYALPLTILAGVAALTSFPWLSFPAAVVLTLWLPGRLVVELLRPLNRAAGRSWMALAASLVLLPVLLNWTWRFSNSRYAILGTVVAANLLLVAGKGVGRKRGRESFSGTEQQVLDPEAKLAHTSARKRLPTPFPNWMCAAFAALIGWLALCVFCSYWLPSGGGRLVPNPAHDYTKHHAVMLSLARHPLPLHNVFCAAEADTPYYYYHYYYLLPAALRAISGQTVSIAFAFGFTSAVLAATLVALVYLLARQIFGSPGGALLSAACTGLIGGWDIIPVLLRVLRGGPMVITLDSWCPVAWRVHNLVTQFVWCPQHVSAVAALLLGALWLGLAPRAAWWWAMAPLLAAAIFGSSTYLAVTIFLGLGLYALLRVFTSRREGLDRGQVLRTGLGLGLLALPLVIRQAAEYAVMARRFEGGLTLHWERFPFAVLGRLLPPSPAANLLDVPWLLLIEWGLPALAVVLAGRAAWRTLLGHPGMRLLLPVAAVGAVAMFIFRSNINPIDYGFRVSIIPAMIVAVLLVGPLLQSASSRRWRLGVLLGGCLLGLPVGLLELPLAAGRSLLQPNPLAPDDGALRFLRDHTSADAVVQGDPRARVVLPQVIDRQMGVVDTENPHVRVFWPKDMAAVEARVRAVERAFGAASSEEAWALLEPLGVTHVLVGTAERRRWGTEWGRKSSTTSGPSPPSDAGQVEQPYSERRLSPFEDGTYFEPLYADDHAAVYRLRKPAAVLAAGDVGDPAP